MFKPKNLGFCMRFSGMMLPVYSTIGGNLFVYTRSGGCVYLKDMGCYKELQCKGL